MERIIEIEHLNKSFGEVKAVRDLSFNVRRGELFAFLGVNGAGKSTTISIMCSCLEKDSGTVKICSMDPAHQWTDISRRMGVVFQFSALDSALSVRDNLESRAALYGITGSSFDKRLKELSELLELDGLLRRPVGKLSGGQRRRVAIAGVIVTKPEILVLDEPAAGLDPLGKKEIMRLLHKIHEEWCKTVIIVSHDMDEISENCTRAAVFSDGKVVMEEAPAALFRRGEELAALGLDVPFTAKITECLARGGVHIRSDFTAADFVKRTLEYAGVGAESAADNAGGQDNA